MLYQLICGLIIGVIFGFVLEKSKVIEPQFILGQFLFKHFVMIKVFVSALLTSLIVLYVLNLLGLFVFKSSGLNVVSSIVGGGLLGVGMGLAGACPGTVFAQLGVGYKNARVTFLGALSAAIVYTTCQPSISAFFAQWTSGYVFWMDILNMTRSTLTLIIGLKLIGFLVLLQAWEKGFFKKILKKAH